jgi:hypothetical protein
MSGCPFYCWGGRVPIRQALFSDGKVLEGLTTLFHRSRDVRALKRVLVRWGGVVLV